MTAPALPLSDLTLSAVQGAATVLRRDEPTRADSAKPLAVVDNLTSALCNVVSTLADGGEPGPDKDVLERTLLDVAAWACLAVEAVIRNRTRPRLSGGSAATGGY